LKILIVGCSLCSCIRDNLWIQTNLFADQNIFLSSLESGECVENIVWAKEMTCWRNCVSHLFVEKLKVIKNWHILYVSIVQVGRILIFKNIPKVNEFT